jgi:hypothetical protein
MKVIVTGFEPFGGERVNPSMEAVRRLPARVGRLQVATRILPTVFGLAWARLAAALEELDPDLCASARRAGARNSRSNGWRSMSRTRPPRLEIVLRVPGAAPHPGPLPAGGEREGPA